MTTTMQQDAHLKVEIELELGINIDGTPDMTFVLDWICRNMSPDEVFTTHDLEQWAEENGYKKDENHD